MKAENPDLWMGINGGIDSLDAAQALLDRGMDEVMIGRAAYQKPANVLLNADERLFDATQTADGSATRAGVGFTNSDKYSDKSRADVVEAMLPYCERHLASGGRLNQVTRHMIGLFAGQPGGRRWRQVLSQRAHLPGAGPEVLLDALAETQRQAEAGGPSRANAA
ncbi:MAG: tRNA-dihydrouridine synthase, partial [Pseudomonadota bacterium]